jgi:hypothetical protein
VKWSSVASFGGTVNLPANERSELGLAYYSPVEFRPVAYTPAVGCSLMLFKQHERITLSEYGHPKPLFSRRHAYTLGAQILRCENQAGEVKK